MSSRSPMSALRSSCQPSGPASARRRPGRAIRANASMSPGRFLRGSMVPVQRTYSSSRPRRVRISVMACGVTGRARDTPRHVAEPTPVEAVGGAVLQRGLRRATDQVGLGPGQSEGLPVEALRPAGMVLWVVQRGEVVHGHDQRHPAGRDGHAAGPHRIDRPGRPLDRRSAQPVPGRIQQRAGQGQLPDRDRGPVRLRGWMAMAGGHADELDVGAPAQRVHRAENRGRGPSGHAVPALFEGHREPHRASVAGLGEMHAGSVVPRWPDT